MNDRDTVEVSVHIAAMPETVFPYFTDPVRYVQWMGREATLAPTAGGTFRVWMRDGVGDIPGHFVEVDPPYRLVFTSGWTHDSAVSARFHPGGRDPRRRGRGHARGAAPLRPTRRRPAHASSGRVDDLPAAAGSDRRGPDPVAALQRDRVQVYRWVIDWLAG